LALRVDVGCQRADDSEISGGTIRSWVAERGRVGEVEELSPQLETDAFGDRQVFEKREIQQWLRASALYSLHR
jgi:hypothetical protein